MDEQSGRTVQIDATIELRDYFRAYVDASKVKLAIACAVVLLLIASFTYFFILIGEQHILLELSPLFFGFPLIAIAGQYLRIHAAYRKYLADLSESEKRVLYIFAEHGDGFEIVNGKNFGHLSWESVRAVVERTHHFRIDLNRYEALVISKRFVHGKADLLLLREIVSSHLGSKAKLLAE
jgi:hypothetical protein